jgi:hypothetical protein
LLPASKKVSHPCCKSSPLITVILSLSISQSLLLSTYWSSLRPKLVPGSESIFLVGSFLSKSRRVLAADGWGVLGGLMGCRPDGVSDRTWKCEVGGGPMGVGRLSEST